MPRNGCHGRGSKTARSERIDLGLELLRIARLPGEQFVQDDLAAWCACTRGAISNIEVKALRKLRRRVAMRRDPVLAELLETVFEHETPYYRHARPIPTRY